MRFVGTALVAGTIGVVFLLAQGGWIRAGTERSAELESATPGTSRRASFQYSHFQDVIGMKVENVDGEKIGTISDLIIDLEAEQPAYAIVKTGGFLGGRRWRIVPMWAMAMKTAKVGIAAIDIARQQWFHAPEFSEAALRSLGQPGKEREIARFYARVGAAPREKMESGNRRLTPTGGVGGQTNNPAEVRMFESAKNLIGSELVGGKNVNVGEITDLLVDLGGTKPSYAIASVGRYSGNDSRYALPTSLLKPLPKQRFAITAEPNDFDRAKPCREGELQELAALGNKQIYRYER
jgi:PRC-barrel domain